MMLNLKLLLLFMFSNFVHLLVIKRLLFLCIARLITNNIIFSAARPRSRHRATKNRSKIDEKVKPKMDGVLASICGGF